jgi:hypothetical protein
MSGRLSNYRSLYRRVILIFCVVLSRTLTAGEGPARTGLPIEVSTPKAETLVTNLNQLGTETRMESGSALDTTLPEVFTPSVNSLNGIMPLPASRSAAPPSRHIRAWMEQQKNWAFQTPEEVVRDIALRDILNLSDRAADGEETRSGYSSGAEGFYEKIWNNRSGTSRFRSGTFFGSQKGSMEGKDYVSPDETKALSSILGRPQRSMKGLFSSDANAEFAGQNSGASQLLEAFGLDPKGDRDSVLSPEELADKARQKEQLKQFQDLLDGMHSVEPAQPERSGAVLNPWSTGSAALAPAPNPLNPFAALPGATPNPALLPPTGPIAPVPSSLSPVPYAVAPDRLSPPRPSFAFPQRAF